jgi:hypothetical protein
VYVCFFVSFLFLGSIWSRLSTPHSSFFYCLDLPYWLVLSVFSLLSPNSGKSTLLDLLADRKTVGRVGGEILFNGLPRSSAVDKSTAYVMQVCYCHVNFYNIQ